MIREEVLEEANTDEMALAWKDELALEYGVTESLFNLSVNDRKTIYDNWEKFKAYYYFDDDEALECSVHDALMNILEMCGGIPSFCEAHSFSELTKHDIEMLLFEGEKPFMSDDEERKK